MRLTASSANGTPEENDAPAPKRMVGRASFSGFRIEASSRTLSMWVICKQPNQDREAERYRNIQQSKPVCTCFPCFLSGLAAFFLTDEPLRAVGIDKLDPSRCLFWPNSSTFWPLQPSRRNMSSRQGEPIDVRSRRRRCGGGASRCGPSGSTNPAQSPLFPQIHPRGPCPRPGTRRIGSIEP
jgi:hypothetical protein